MAFLKQSDMKPVKKAKAPVAVAEIPTHRDSPDVAHAINRLASIVSTYVTQARDGDNGSGLYSKPNGYPVRVALTGTDSDDEANLNLYLHGDNAENIAAGIAGIADALKRIADAMTK